MSNTQVTRTSRSKTVVVENQIQAIILKKVLKESRTHLNILNDESDAFMLIDKMSMLSAYDALIDSTNNLAYFERPGTVVVGAISRSAKKVESKKIEGK